MRDAYHVELDTITDAVVEMTNMVGSAMAKATTALLSADLQLAEAVIAADEAVDEVYRDTERRAFDVLATQQPVASDLRMLVTSLRMVADLERMGDLALHVAKVARRRYPAHAVPAELRPTLLRMGHVAEEIAANAGRVLAQRDVALAEQLERDDDEMDDLHRELFKTMLDDRWEGGIECAVDIALVGRYYERFADHAVSVARRVVYLVTGERPEPVAG